MKKSSLILEIKRLTAITSVNCANITSIRDAEEDGVFSMIDCTGNAYEVLLSGSSISVTAGGKTASFSQPQKYVEAAHTLILLVKMAKVSPKIFSEIGKDISDEKATEIIHGISVARNRSNKKACSI